MNANGESGRESRSRAQRFSGAQSRQRSDPQDRIRSLRALAFFAGPVVAAMKAPQAGEPLAPQPISIDTLRRKYAAPGEPGADAVRRRVARALASVERDPAHWEGIFFATQKAGFIPGGRINAAAGTGLATTLVNCFVQPIGDSISGREGDAPGIYPALQEAALTLRRGGGVGYDFSP